MRSKPASFFLHYVRHVALISVARMDVNKYIVSKCKHIHSLALSFASSGPGLLPILSSTPLQRLAADLEALFGSTSDVDFSHGLFAHLTHLNIYTTPVPNAWSAGLAELPCLTHLSVGVATAAFFRRVVVDCVRLEVAALVNPDVAWLRDYLKENQPFIHDARCVLVVVDDLLDDWELAAHGYEDHWRRAERFIKERRAREIDGKPLLQSLATRVDISIASDCIVYPCLDSDSAAN
jgi:hypothetical protein